MKDSGVSLRYDKLKQEMKKQNFDVVIAISPENVLYFSETYIQTQKSIRDRLAIAVLPLEQDPAMIACVIEEPTVENECWIKDRRYYFEFRESPIQFLVDVLTERGLLNKRIGIEMDYLSAAYYRELMQRLPNVKIESCLHTFNVVRSIKEEREIEILQHAALVTRDAYTEAISEVGVGSLETDFSKRIAKKMIDGGCTSIEFLVMGTGDRSILVHGLPENLPMANHTHGRIDFGGLFDHYNLDVARTFIIGEPNAKHVDVFDRMMEVYVAAVEACQLGAPANSVYFTAKAMSEKMGLPFNRVHSGHGLGLSVHEYPMLAPGNETPLEENMVMCVEHAVHVDGFRYHIEDLVRITPHGPVVLSAPEGFHPTYQIIK